ncbi:DNA polymerase IV [Nostoc sp.]|uniref:DNA polymerase IV n=1 Tax=Nostoc sp. TaxID=1180 RepID=UPI002FFD16B3
MVELTLRQESIVRIRKIVHVDMDAFYASVEQRDNPSYRGKPLVVGGSSNQRGVVAAASYEARKFGIHSAMPSVTAIAKCPGLIFVRPRFDLYRDISTSIHAIFKRYTDLVEGVALDEAYLDVTQNKQNITYASTIARHIKTAIFEETKLTATAGVSINKFLAKMASGQNKPNGLYIAIKYNIDTAKAKSTVYSDLILLFRYIDFQLNAFFQAAKVS